MHPQQGGLAEAASPVLPAVQRGEGVPSVFGPGDCFYEPGNVDHHARNEGQVPVRLFNFQILPKDWEGSSAITVTAAA